jgi:hypothetical protein
MNDTHTYVHVHCHCVCCSLSQADRFGRRITYAAGSVLFLGTSLGCIFAPTIGVLVAFRALQGLAGAALEGAGLKVESFAGFSSNHYPDPCMYMHCSVFSVFGDDAQVTPHDPSTSMCFDESAAAAAAALLPQSPLTRQLARFVDATAPAVNTCLLYQPENHSKQQPE